MAQVIAHQLVQTLAPTEFSIMVDSAGVAASDGYNASQEAVIVMNQRGIDLSGHQSKMLTTELVEWADVIFAMTPSHAQAVLRGAPHAKNKVFPVDTKHPVLDPIGSPIGVYCEVADQLEGLIRARLEEIIS